MRSALVALAVLVAAGTAAPAVAAVESGCPDGVESATGANPSYADTAELLEEAAAAHDVPPQVLKAIAYREGFDHTTGRRWAQYEAGGPVVISTDGKCGVGIMQVTATYPGVDPVRLATDIAYNVDRGAAILAEKYAANQAQNPPAVGPDDRYLVENWYYAACAYNGCTGESTTYTDAIAAAVRDPFRYLPEVRPWAPPLGYTRPQDADPSYDFPAGFQARRDPGELFFYDGAGVETKTVAAATHDWRTPPAVAYPAMTYGPDGPHVTCAGCEWWRLAEGAGLAGRAHWTKSNGAAAVAVVRWAPPLPRRGTYRVLAHVPVVGADELGEAFAGPPGHATYAVAGVSATASVAVDQAATAGTWVSLGDYLLQYGSTVRLDDRGDAAGTTRLVADAVRFVALTRLDLAVSASSVTYPGTVTLTARLSQLGSTTGLPGRAVALYRRPRGTTAWTRLGTWATRSDGRIAVVTRPVRNSEYQARYVPSGPGEAAATSGRRTVLVRPLVRAALDRTAAPPGGTVRVSAGRRRTTRAGGSTSSGTPAAPGATSPRRSCRPRARRASPCATRPAPTTCACTSRPTPTTWRAPRRS